MQCDYFDAGVCASCTWLARPYADQLTAKQERAERLLSAHQGLRWLPPVPSPEAGFRNKAKMVVGGTLAEPTFGILDGAGRGVDLRRCGLHTPAIRAALPHVAAFVQRAAVVPYDVPARRGELKHVLLTESPDGELMVRFVLRSQEAVSRLRKHLPSLLAEVPAVRVASVNLLPEHRAALEGEREILLTEQESLAMRLGAEHVHADEHLRLHLRPQSFFQTNTAIAAALYRQAQEWVDALDPATVWDLYCGVGGFALHLARPGREVLGVESSAEAVASATTSAREAGFGGVRFVAGDATRVALSASTAPDVVVVNPPRRGIGSTLAGWLETSDVGHVVYSSCNVATLASDLVLMPSLRPVEGRVLDMFPQTTHDEVMVLLERA